jgi:CheY-like chemotaxis protein
MARLPEPARQRSPDAEARIRALQDDVDELMRARAAAVETARRRDEFVNTIAHELRSPLNAILGWTQLLEPRQDLPPDVADALRVIRRNALRQRQLLDEIARSDGAGRASAFSVSPPALGDDAGARLAGAEPAAAICGSPLAGVRVLAVDDEPDWRELLGYVLRAAGSEPRIAGSAGEALQVLDAWQPDVVLTDIAMPGTDGYGLLAAIRSRGGSAPALPVVAMTAHAGTVERIRTARAGFAEHLAKPIPPRELVDAVRRVAEQVPRARGAGSG